MKPNYRNTVIKRGFTSDIEKICIDTFNKHWRECSEFAQQFRRETENETCKAIFDWVIDNLIYEEDPIGEQWVQTPARLVIGTKKGDCKSFSILIASVLRCLEIPGYFRFVAFNGKNITHVYVVTNSGIIIDTVERPVRFNYARKFNIKKDVDYMRDTLISVLSGIAEDKYNEYFSDDKWFLDCTVAENYLYSEINLAMTDLKFARDDDERRNCFDRFLLMFCTLDSYEFAKNDKRALVKLSSILQYLYDNGAFSYQADKLEETLLVEQLDKVTEQAINFLLGNEIFEQDGEIKIWFEQQIITYDKRNSVNSVMRENYIKQVAELTNREIAGIGAATTAEKNELISRMKSSAPYFIYDLAGENYIDGLNNRVMKSKMKYQNNVRNNWSSDLAGVFNYQTIKNHIETGYKEQSRGATAIENIEEGIKNPPAIGDFGISAILAIISTIIAILVSIFTLIKTIIQTFTGDTSNLSAGKANSSDFAGFSGGGNKTTTNNFLKEDSLGLGIPNGWLLGGAAGIFGLIYLANRNND